MERVVKRSAGVEPHSVLPVEEAPPAEQFARHFFRCLFCCIGDRYNTDYFCETGRDLIVAMLDEMDGRP